MKVELEDLGAVQKKLTVELPADLVTEEIELAYKTLSTQAELPGFRKGKVPELTAPPDNYILNTQVPSLEMLQAV